MIVSDGVLFKLEYSSIMRIELANVVTTAFEVRPSGLSRCGNANKCGVTRRFSSEELYGKVVYDHLRVEVRSLG